MENEELKENAQAVNEEKAPKKKSANKKLNEELELAKADAEESKRKWYTLNDFESFTSICLPPTIFVSSMYLSFVKYGINVSWSTRPACLAAKSISHVHAILFDKVREKKEPDKTDINFYEV